MVDLNGVEVFNHSTVVELLVDLVFPECMLNVVVLHLIAPAVIEVMNFACNLTAVLQVECLIDFTEAAFAENGQNEVFVVQHCISLAPVDAAVLGLFLITDALEFNQVGALLLLEH